MFHIVLETVRKFNMRSHLQKNIFIAVGWSIMISADNGSTWESVTSPIDLSSTSLRAVTSK